MMRIYLIWTLIFTLFLTPHLWAQDDLSTKKHIALAEKLTEEGKFAAAALHYESAWRQKNNKLEWLNAAAELYLRARDYRKAVDAFSTLRDNKEYPMARLNYALALKQNGQFDEAIPEFLLFLNNYEGKDRPKIQDKIEDQIAGCTLAIKQSEAGKDEKYTIEHMSANINSTENDFAPVPFGDDIVYFTSSPNGQERILRSQQLSVDWSLAAAVENLPIPMGTAFGNGAFSPDGNRFYFAQWSKGKKKKEKKPSCSIFVIQREGSEWSAPKALPEGVNTEGGIATTPFVLSKGEKDLLFFASDKTGGRGGLDIWYTVVNPKTNQCENVQNIGGLINTEGDEIAPFYEVEEKTLYFASNGRPTFGGYDIFKSAGSEQIWATPENMGAPFNTGADDYYFVKNKSRTGGFFASNRALGMEKISSRDDDVYFFRINESKDLALDGKVFEKEPRQTLENARVSLFERKAKEDPKLLSSIVTADGQFHFALLPHKAYTAEVEKEGYQVVRYEFKTDTVKGKLGRDFTLEKILMMATLKTETSDDNDREEPEEDTKKQPVTDKNSRTNTEKIKKTDVLASNTAIKTEKKATATTDEKPLKNVKTEKLDAATDRSEEKEAVKIEKSTAFKIQIIAYESLDLSDRRRIARVEDLGELEAEKVSIGGRNMTRVMLMGYGNRQEAASILKKVKDRSLRDAFIVRYENGKRQ